MRNEPDFPLSYIDYDGSRIAYADHGNGPPLLLLHGSLCDCRYWHAQIKTLGAHFRVIAPSLRHYWPEAWDGRGVGFSVAQHTADALALLARLGMRGAHVVGHSRGAKVALNMAINQPATVHTLTLADPGIALPGQADRRGDFRERAFHLIGEGRTDEGLAIFIDAVSGAGTWPRMVPWFRQMAHDNARTLLGQVHERNEPLDESLLRSLNLPVLLIGGALSPAPYPQIIDYLERALPDTQRVTIAGSSHGMNIGNPRVFNQAIISFLLG